ncbi:hypothetical protein BDEG_24807 [Batrachochytrium dendrobatidis JEL423]|uniref:Uncharacterized protein n=1 Tax=Batrachochytrium dendrobatidis (strain JEL423) TaxID=403673 RepID=A0A177WMY1_BATDL|nr:hypothetical protein BDEG_24807 [Batrachochytrium dendrobatidis JEL423]
MNGMINAMTEPENSTQLSQQSLLSKPNCFKRSKPEIADCSNTETLVAKRRRSAVPAVHHLNVVHTDTCISSSPFLVPEKASRLSFPTTSLNAGRRLDKFPKSPARIGSKSLLRGFLRTITDPNIPDSDIQLTASLDHKDSVSAAPHPPARGGRARNPFAIRQENKVFSSLNKPKDPFSLLSESLQTQSCSTSTAIETTFSTSIKSKDLDSVQFKPLSPIDHLCVADRCADQTNLSTFAVSLNHQLENNQDNLVHNTSSSPKLSSCQTTALDPSFDSQHENDASDELSKKDAIRFYDLLSRKKDTTRFQIGIDKLEKWKSAILIPSDTPIIDASQNPTVVKGFEAKSERHIQTLDSLPHVDSTLKTEIVVTSNYSLDWCNFENSSQESRCLTQFTSLSDPAVTPCEKFMCNTFHWSYGSIPVSPTLQQCRTRIFAKQRQGVALADHEKFELKCFQDSEEEWKHSFQSLYFTLKNSETLYFYYASSQFTALFVQSSLISNISLKPKQVSSILNGATSPFVVYLTRVTMGTRIQLEKEDIQWELVESASNVAQTDLKSDGSEKILQLNETDDENVYDGEDVFISGPRKWKHARSLATLRIVDSKSVHALFDYILNWTDPSIEARASCLPTLISPKPFLNAQLKRMKVLRNSKVQVAHEDSLTGQSTIQHVYKLHLSGTLLPTHFEAMLHCLVEQQRKSAKEYGSTSNQTLFSVKATTDHSTIGLPAIFSLARDAHTLSNVQSITATNGWLLMK